MTQEELEFYFVDEKGNRTMMLSEADKMVVDFHCDCGEMLQFQKQYQPAPLHYETLLKHCGKVQCEKCNAIYWHSREHGLDGTLKEDDIYAFKDSNFGLVGFYMFAKGIIYIRIWDSFKAASVRDAEEHIIKSVSHWIGHEIKVSSYLNLSDKEIENFEIWN